MTTQKVSIASVEIVSSGSELVVGFSDGTYTVFPVNELFAIAPATALDESKERLEDDGREPS